ncbi:arginine--tRNA ligase [Salininema proteolyticum]|uniref:Arginine--tRNA ligase n=1 Tax=Salininema proteolyticum TaxID=1607685 RepID=A0ABV8TYE7_9ACTN
MTPETLAEKVLSAAAAAFNAAGLDASLLPATTAVERPRNPEHGDYASTLALQVAKKAGTNPRQLAERIAAELTGDSGIAKVELAGPGFLNITLAAGAAGEIAGSIVAQGPRYGTNTAMAGERVNLEFVSANPTGPVHLGGTRWAAVGNALARTMEASGADVVQEYYFNDAGAQIDRFAESLYAAAQGRPVPEDGYAGAYIDDIAQAIVDRNPEVLEGPNPQTVFRTQGIELMFDDIKKSLADFGVEFDVYFNERDLHDEGALDAALETLAKAGHVYEKDGATWLRTSTFGDDKDRPLKKSDGAWTYFAADCAYYLDKRKRGFEHVILVLGADHHGYVGRMKAMVQCFGDDADRLEILIGQFVNLVRDGKPVRMSKRAGTVVTLDDIIEQLGVDATRYALARYSMDTSIDLDIDQWTKHSSDNPVYYVQYAHSRISSIIRNAAEQGIILGGTYNASKLTHEREVDLLKALAEFPKVVAGAAELREVHRIARYAEDLAGAYHRFYNACRVIPRADETFTDTNLARLWLVEATRVTLKNALHMLGVSAPDRM